MTNFINQILRKLNIQIKRFPDSDTRRRLLIMNRLKIDLVFDVGANSGQYVKNLREIGFRDKAISFEPIDVVYKELASAAKKDPCWITENFAIGDQITESTINVSQNTYSSSILSMLPAHSESAPNSIYVSQQKIQVKTLDSVFKQHASSENKVMLKIDTQGYEKSVLEGAKKSLPNVSLIQLEMSLKPLYENEMIFLEMIDYLSDKGFELYSIENGFANPDTGQLLQVDGIFVNKAKSNILNN